MKWDDPPAAHKMGMMNRPSIWILDQRPLKIIKKKRVIRQGFGCHQGAVWVAWPGTAGYWWAAGGWSGVGRRRGTICLRKWTKSWDWRSPTNTAMYHGYDCNCNCNYHATRCKNCLFVWKSSQLSILSNWKCLCWLQEKERSETTIP